MILAESDVDMTPNVEQKCGRCGGSISPRELRCTSCRKLSRRGTKLIAVLVISSLIIASLIAVVVLQNAKTEEQIIMTDRKIGVGENDFWLNYTSKRMGSNSPVPHPSWVLSALENGPVMIFVHIENCMACAVQAPICSAVNDTYIGQITYFDLLAGRDDGPVDEALLTYDPSGGSQLVPLVVVINQVQDADGNRQVLWHSWEGIVSLPYLDSWINDSVAHHQNGP
jgi:hypothetical protein